jgi:hypothetical protein
MSFALRLRQRRVGSAFEGGRGTGNAYVTHSSMCARAPGAWQEARGKSRSNSDEQARGPLLAERGRIMPHDPPAHRGIASEAAAASETPPIMMLAVKHYATHRWVQAPIMALALWLVVSPFTLGYSSRALVWSDVLSGLLALVLSLLALSPRRGLASWLVAFVGLWLLFAPLVFWSPDAAAYANDTLVGALLVVFGLIIPLGTTMHGAAIPEGWSYNPSAWPQRVPVIALAFMSFLVARYMAAFQLGHIRSVWDPVFGGAAEGVLRWQTSRGWPVSEAGLAATIYLIEVLLGLMGDPRRWRTMPWIVAGFGFIVLPLGVVSIVLVILQPLAVGAWCSPCLFMAAAMLLMIPLSLDEIVATVQLLVQKKRQGLSVWRVFWLGANVSEDCPTWGWLRPRLWHPRAMTWGLSASARLLASTAVGVWLMMSPAVFGVDIEQAAADSDHVAGVLIVVVAVISLGEVARPGRFLLLPLGVWLVAAPWLLDGGTMLSRSNSAVMGALLAALSLQLGPVRDRYGAYDAIARWSPGAKARHRPARGADRGIGAPANG